jgi:hypothetical protein
MSVEAISWALNLAPVPADRGGQPSSGCKFVLVGLASHAGPDGSGAFPSVATLVRYTGLSSGRCAPAWTGWRPRASSPLCDPDIVAARIKRADRRPEGWDLDLSLIRPDLTATEAAALERQFPVWPPGPQRPPARMPARLRAGCNHRTPQALWKTERTGCSSCTLHPSRGAGSAATGCNERGHGVQQLHSNLTKNHASNRPPPPRVRTRPRPARLA